MSHRVVITSLLALSVATWAQAQGSTPSPACSQLFTGDACQKSVDLFAYVAPQLGTLIAGGSPVLGQGAVLSFIGSGRPVPGISAGLRVNFLGASLPDLTNVPISISGPSNSTPIPLDNLIVLGPTLDAAVGLFQGFSIGVTDILGVDLLLSAIYLPDYEGDGIRVATSGSGLKLGWGARLALVRETIATPALTASFLRRQLPTVDLDANSNSGSNDASFTVAGLSKTTDSWRMIVSKNFVVLALAVGAGPDSYAAEATGTAVVNGTNAGPVRLVQNVSRFTYFADITARLGPLRLSAEIGRVQGGNIATFNVFDGARPDASRTYGSIGARFGI
jgi:hypothetical protein